MRAEVVAVGTELLLGQIDNTNARWLSEQLAAAGADVSFHQTVGDNLERIVQSLRLAASRADVVIVTGGLGPTQDDITRDALALVMGVRMERHEEIARYLRERFRGFGRGEMPESNLRQADVPAGARYIMPQSGTAPGLIAELAGGAIVYLVPGVPGEMVEMMQGPIVPELMARSGSVIVSRVLRSSGIGESALAEMVADLFDSTTNPSIAFLASGGEVRIRITAKAESTAEAEASIAPVVERLLERLGDAIFTVEDESLEEAVVRLLRAAGRTLACAESLTGGAVGARLTSVAGASDVFAGSAVVYVEEAKRALLDVPDEVLRDDGPVSEACAQAMAAGARRVFGTDIALALTGAAGPEPHGGASPGTVWLALDAGEIRHVRGFVSPGGRGRVRRWAEQAGLDLVRRHLEVRPLPVSDRVI